MIGQKDAIAHLQNSLRTGRISHAYILSGERGSGKRALAAAFSQTLICRQRKEEDGLLEPCGLCHDCVRAEAGTHPDIITVEPAKKPEEGKKPVLGVDDIRRMRADVAIRPYESDWKVYIIPNAEQMTQQAQNALLKTLEEPPAYAVILLLADSLTGFLPTVLSRCIVLKLRPTPEEYLAGILEKQYGADHQKAVICARLSGGNAGRAAELAQSAEFEAFRTKSMEFLRNLPDRDAFEVAKFAGELGADTQEFTDLARCFYRDVLVFKSTGEPAALIFQDEVKYIRESAGKLSFRALESIQESFDLAALRMKRGGNDAQIMEMMLLSIREAVRAGAQRI